jgi:hypothetical protein
VKEFAVTNPWTKKNPFMSMWLSGANAVVSRAKGQAAASMSKQRATLATQTVRFWTGAMLATTKPRKRR